MKFTGPTTLTREQLREDFARARNLGRVRLGEHCVYVQKFSGARCLPYGQIRRAWVRQEEVNANLCCGRANFDQFYLCLLYTSGGSARSEESCTLEELCAAAARLTRNGGRFALCHRPERLCDVLCALREHGLEPKRLKLISHAPGHPPSVILVEGVRQGKPGLSIEG